MIPGPQGVGGGTVPGPIVLTQIVGWIGLVFLPWYGLNENFWAFAWLGHYPDVATAPAIIQATQFGRPLLWPVILAAIPPFFVLSRPRTDPTASRRTSFCSAAPPASC
jgi:hypothetical protein